MNTASAILATPAIETIMANTLSLMHVGVEVRKAFKIAGFDREIRIDSGRSHASEPSVRT